MRVLVIGSGGREHALCVKLAQSPRLTALYCVPGNAGISEIAKTASIGITDIAGLVNFALSQHIELVICGPETPLVLGLGDACRKEGLVFMGPSQAAAALEGSKAFMKQIVTEAGIATAAYRRFTLGENEVAKAYIHQQGAPIVIKTDGLAAGKGVVVAMNIAEACQAVDDMLLHQKFGSAGQTIIIESFLEGEEFSLFALCDGTNTVSLGMAQDHKRAYDGDQGPNTGGMGAYSLSSDKWREIEAKAMEEVIKPLMTTMKALSIPYSGILFAGLMVGKAGIKPLEFNIRFGDPETQVVLARLESDLVTLLYQAATHTLDDTVVHWSPNSALTIVMAAKGYPGAYKSGSEISWDPVLIPKGASILHAGTKRGDSGALLADGGRVLNIVAKGQTVKEAYDLAYQTVKLVKWDDSHYRTDIAKKVL